MKAQFWPYLGRVVGLCLCLVFAWEGHCLFLFPSPHLHRLVWLWLTKPPPTSRGTNLSLPSTLLISLPLNWYTEEIPLTKVSIFQSCRQMHTHDAHHHLQCDAQSAKTVPNLNQETKDAYLQGQNGNSFSMFNQFLSCVTSRLLNSQVVIQSSIVTFDNLSADMTLYIQPPQMTEHPLAYLLYIRR